MLQGACKVQLEPRPQLLKKGYFRRVFSCQEAKRCKFTAISRESSGYLVDVQLARCNISFNRQLTVIFNWGADYLH